MAKLTLADLSNLQNETTATTAINANSDLIETALENTLSRDGTSPNSMEAALDMNSNRIINLPEPSNNTEPLRLQDLEDFLDGDLTVNSNTLSYTGVTRADIPTTNIGTGKTFMALGYTTQGDLGAGAIYTSVGANSSSLNAIQDNSGVWFKLVLDGYNNAGWWGATGDGSTDDTAAIARAVAGTPSGGTLYFPPGNYKVTDGFSLTTPITILGSGNTILSGSGTCFTLALGFSGTKSLFEVTTTVFTPGWRFEAFQVQGGLLGAYGIEFKGTAGWYNVLINFVTIVSMGSGYSIAVTGAATTAGLSYSTISNCNLSGGLYLNYAGDGINIQNNVISGASTSRLGIYYNAIVGAGGLYVGHNVISGSYVFLAVDNAVAPVIFANEFETNAGVAFGSSSCIQIGSSLFNTSSNILAPQYINNGISVLSGTADPIPLYVNNTYNANIRGGKFLIQNPGTPYHIVVDTVANNTLIDIGNGTEYITNGSIGSAHINDSGTATHQISDFVKGQAPATATNDNAAAGNVGEIIEGEVLVGSAVGLTSTTAADITSISLTAGDWDVWGNICTNPAGGTTSTQTAGWISTTSATAPTAPNKGAYTLLGVSTTAGLTMQIPVGQRRISVSSTTTVYLSCKATFAVSTMGAYGYIAARRVR